MITINGTNSYYSVGDSRVSQAAHPTRLNLHRGKQAWRKARHCNICKQLFTPGYRYQLFCGKCRAVDDSFIFNEWLPRISTPLPMAAGF